jgi:heptaprenyl diphosphate synthase
MIDRPKRLISAQELRAAVETRALSQELAPPLDHLFASGGKQLRAALVWGSAEAGPDPSVHSVREGATAVELFHLGTLAHDDVVDDGRLRRGIETVGVAHGSRASGFAGMVLLGAAAELMARHGQEANEVFAEAVSEICEGEMAEVEDLFNADRPVERYFHAISGKTAAGFGFAGWVGAWLAGADCSIAARTRHFGHELGMAFQILDDALDLCGPTATGKQRGKDLEQGVYTMPVLSAALTDPSLKRELGRPIEEGNLDLVVERVIASGGMKRTEEACSSFADRAKDAIGEIPSAARRPLLELLDAALEPLDQLHTAADLSHA